VHVRQGPFGSGAGQHGSAARDQQPAERRYSATAAGCATATAAQIVGGSGDPGAVRLLVRAVAGSDEGQGADQWVAALACR